MSVALSVTKWQNARASHTMLRILRKEGRLPRLHLFRWPLLPQSGSERYIWQCRPHHSCEGRCLAKCLSKPIEDAPFAYFGVCRGILHLTMYRISSPSVSDAALSAASRGG